jgi:hypothetical protein
VNVAVIAIEGERARAALAKASEEIKKSEAELRSIIDARPQLSVSLGPTEQHRQGERRIDLATERLTNHPARPGVQNHCEVDEAGGDANVRDIADPGLIGARRLAVTG